MPRLKSEPLAEVSAVKAAILFDRELPRDGSRYFFEMDAAPGSDPYLELWEAHREAVLAAWIAERPGTRPKLWWRYDAPRWNAPKEHRGWYYVPTLPEPRVRVGGVGVPAFEVSAYAPQWPLGIPDPWDTIDADDLPLFEAQARYLKRHGLFLPGEEARLTAADFEPEAVDATPLEMIARLKRLGI